MSPETLDHQHSAAIEAAAEWLNVTPRERINMPIIPALRSRFNLTVKEAIAAIEAAGMLRRESR